MGHSRYEKSQGLNALEILMHDFSTQGSGGRAEITEINLMRKYSIQSFFLNPPTSIPLSGVMHIKSRMNLVVNFVDKHRSTEY